MSLVEFRRFERGRLHALGTSESLRVLRIGMHGCMGAWGDRLLSYFRSFASWLDAMCLSA